MTDMGYKQDLFSAWFAMYGPAGLPEELKKVLIPAIEKTINSPVALSRPAGNTSKAFVMSRPRRD
jgi:tripartite-type tricarboxylate transporter receptor subunit TctC